MIFLLQYFSVFINVFWVVLTLFGYFFWSWDIGQTILFLNISFFSLFFNFYLSLCELTYKNTIKSAINKQFIHQDLAQPLVVIWQIFVFLFNIGLFTFSLAISTIIFGAIVGSYFYKAMQVKDLDQFFAKWNGQWTQIILLALAVLIIEYLGHRRELKKLNVHGIKDWNIFLPMIPKVKRKFNVYFWGSIVAIIIDGLLSDFKSFGFICLIWLFVCTVIWSWIDLHYKSVPLPIEAYREEIDE